MQTYLTKNCTYCPTCKAKLELSSNFASCPTCHFTFYSNPAPCTAAVIHAEGKVLLAKRAIEPRKDYWDVVGGFIENGETAEIAVLREVKEETNLDTKIVQYLGSYPDIYGETLLPTLIFIYQLKIIGGEMKPQDDVAELRWFSWDELPTEFAFANVQPALNLLKKSLEKSK